MEVRIIQEKRNEIERVQRAFRDQLSDTQILRATAQGINSALSRSIPQINKAIKAEYRITQKYLSRMAVVSPKASSAHLWGGIRINERNIPLIAFRPKQAGGSIEVAIHKGKTVYIRNSFIATMKSGHVSIFSRGHYEKTGFIPGIEPTTSGKNRITELQTASVFGMGTGPKIGKQVRQFMDTEVSARVEGILLARVTKITR